MKKTELTDTDIREIIDIYKKNDRSVRSIAQKFRIDENRCKRILVDNGVYDAQSRVKRARASWNGWNRYEK